VKRLLFLSQTLPYPPDGGVNIRTYHVLRLLAQEFAISALCFYRRQDRASREAVEAGLAGLRTFVRADAFPIPQEHAPWRRVWDHARSVIHRRAYTVYAYESSGFRARLDGLLASRSFDVVHVDSLDLSAYLPALAGLPIVCTHHNVESVLLRRRAERERAPWRRAYLAWQAGLVERVERMWCERVALNVAVSRSDREELGRIAPRATVTVVPNGVDVSTFEPAPGADDGIVFVGGANWFPNRDALEYFCRDILPLVRARCGSVSVRWVGRCSERDAKTFGERHGVALTGYVADVRPYVRDAACYVVPLRVGGGTRLKILDAWAMGKAVVSTSIGCEGLTAVDGVNILVRDTAAGFAEAVRTVLADEAFRAHLGGNGRRTVEGAYDWNVIGRELLRSYRSLGDGLPSRGAAMTSALADLTGPSPSRE